MSHVGKRAFTLIELLVVIAIVAMLLGILIPALSNARRYATSAACLNNERSMSRAWLLYCESNENRMPGGAIAPERMYDGFKSVPPGGQGDPDRHRLWVWPPVDATLAYMGANGQNPTLEDRKRGLERGGLYVYLESIDVFHCPADNEYLRVPPFRYRGYSIAAGLAVYNTQSEYAKLNEIHSSGDKYVFVEEDYDGAVANFNHNAWDFEPWENDFHDPLALFHNDSSTFGFADGHAEKYKWKDDRTVEYFTSRSAAIAKYTMPGLAQNNPDLQWLQIHFAYRK